MKALKLCVMKHNLVIIIMVVFTSTGIQKVIQSLKMDKQNVSVNQVLLKQLMPVLMKMKTVILTVQHPKLSMEEDIRKELKNV
jgi:hypothetical protein